MSCGGLDASEHGRGEWSIIRCEKGREKEEGDNGKPFV